MPDERDETEIRAACEAGDLVRGATLLLDRYQDEVYSFLVGRLDSESDAHEVFSQLCEDVWVGLPRFRWRCSARTWMYTLARNAALRHRRTPANNPARRVPLSQIPEPIEQRRSSTRPYLRTESKDQLAALRRQLDPEERAILTLRVDRGLPWLDVARIVHDAPDADDATLQRLATNLRQRFAKVKKRIMLLARASGLLERPD